MNLNILTERIANNDKLVLDVKYQIQNLEEELYKTSIWKNLQEAKAILRETEESIQKEKEITINLMLEKGLKKVQMLDRSFCLKESPGALKVIDENNIPLNYFIEKISKQLDKTAVKEAIKRGEIIPGACIEKSYSLLIKFTKDE